MFQLKNYACISLLLASFTVSANMDPRFVSPNSDAKKATTVVDLLLVKTYKRMLSDGEYTASRLNNAPISGETEKQGKNLLTFAASNNFKKLAEWGLKKAALMNTGDRNNNTMLIAAVANHNINMLRFALRNRANPNLQSGHYKDTMLSAMMRWQWPESGFYLARQYAARPRSKEERLEIIDYLKSNFPSSSTRLIQYFRASPLVNLPLWSSNKGDPVETDMLTEMDHDLFSAMTGPSPKLNADIMAKFSANGKDFETFLANNGFTKALVQRLSNMPASTAMAQIKEMDSVGNDLLVASIKSLNSEAVEAVLKINASTINKRIPAEPFYDNKGLRPLHIAILQQAPNRIFHLLFKYGADATLTDSNYETPLTFLNKQHKQGDIPASVFQRIRAQLLIHQK